MKFDLCHFTANSAAMAICVLRFHGCGYNSIHHIPDLWISWGTAMEQNKEEYQWDYICYSLITVLLK